MRNLSTQNCDLQGVITKKKSMTGVFLWCDVFEWFLRGKNIQKRPYCTKISKIKKKGKEKSTKKLESVAVACWSLLHTALTKHTPSPKVKRLSYMSAHTHMQERYYSPRLLHTMTGINKNQVTFSLVAACLWVPLCPSYLHSLGTLPLLGLNIA